MKERLKIFIGTDARQPVAYNVLRSSIEATASKPVDIQPLLFQHMPVKRRGLTDFSYTRYLVPYLCNYLGQALFMDADMLVRDDIYKIVPICEDQDVSVCVVKNPIRFEWSSLMYFDCSASRRLTVEVVETGNPMDFKWAYGVGDIPAEWNHLVSYNQPNPDAKIVHFSQGIPVWPETKDCEFAKEWFDAFRRMNSTVSFDELMGPSVHAAHMAKANK